MKKQVIYLENKDLDDAINEYYQLISQQIPMQEIEIKTKEALNYVTSQAIFAQKSSPNYNASAMDGFCVIDKETQLASETSPVYLKQDQFLYVDTGDVIKEPYNAVIMIEHAVLMEDGTLMITTPAAYFQHIRPIGEDITQSQMILPSYHRIRALDIGPILASKNEYVKVFKPLRMGIISTGDEIVDVGETNYQEGMIIDANSAMIKALATDIYLQAHVYPIVKDDMILLQTAIKIATKENDIVIINAGSSAGSEDYTSTIIAQLGQVIVHGLAIKPGKPAIFGIIDQTMVFGLPGYPVAAYIVFEQVVKPIINKRLQQTTTTPSLQARLTKTVYSSLKHLEFVRVKVGFVNNQWVCTPLARGAGVSMSLVEADGIIIVPKNAEGIVQETIVEVKLMKPIDQIMKQVTLIGSHDLIIDVMQDVLKQRHQNLMLSSSHIGSYGGLLALKKHECSIAPCHILDSSGLYNHDAIKKVFKQEKMLLIKGVKRRQVLAFALNNPKNIHGISDVVREDIKYVNRQAGSGTAILFDYLLQQYQIDKAAVQGYDFIMPSHFNVAAAISNQTADCGLVIKSVADTLKLDYVEVLSEDYDFVIYETDLNTPSIQAFITLLKSPEFKKALEIFNCYDTSNSGLIEEV